MTNPKPLSCEDCVTDDWLTTEEGWAAQAEVHAIQAERSALIDRNVDVEMYESHMDHMRPSYGMSDTQLMLF